MTPLVFAAVLGAAALHAGWNAAVKSGGDKRAAMLRLSLGQAAFGLMLVPFFDLPGVHVWPWIGASCLIHVAYQMCLAAAYHEGDLSRVYPISRGSAPMAVLAFTLITGFEGVTPQEALGCLVLGAGILTMARGVWASGESRRLLPFALGAAVATAAYTLVDGLGARAMGTGPGYVAWILLGSGLLYLPVAWVFQPGVRLAATGRAWRVSGLAAGASFAAYAIAVWAMTQAPIALVAALRETSILFAVLIGWLWLGDRMTRGKWSAVALIVAGVIALRL